MIPFAPSLPGRSVMGRVRTILIGLLMGATMWGCGYNDLQGLDEDTKAAWSEVVNQYQRRADLIPNLVATVKGYAAHENSGFNAESAISSTRVHALARGRLHARASACKPPKLFRPARTTADTGARARLGRRRSARSGAWRARAWPARSRARRRAPARRRPRPRASCCARAP